MAVPGAIKTGLKSDVENGQKRRNVIYMNWLFKSSLYFNVCFVLGLLFWVVLGFDFKTDELRMIAAESNLPLRLPTQAFAQDAYLPKIIEDKNILNAIADKELEALLIGNDEDQKEVNEQLHYQEAFLSSFEGSYADLTVDEEGNKLVSSTSNTIDYEDIKSCKPNRLGIEKIIEGKKKYIADFLIERDDPAAIEERVLPRRCVTHVMNKFNLSSYFFALCSSSAGAPSRGGTKPCISKNLVNYTYNALVDVADCMNINPKSLLPKLSNESGLIINTFGSGMDAGIGQLTGDAIEETNKYFDNYLREIREAATAGKSSCQRILKNPKLIAKVGASSSVRCGLISPVENPLLNILYMGIYNRINSDYLSGIKFKAGRDFIGEKAVKQDATDVLAGSFEKNNVKKLMKDAGLDVDRINFHRMVEMVTLLGYNAGPGTAMKMFMDYLNRRVNHNKLPNAKKRLLTDADFDFHNPKKNKDDIDGVERTVVEIARLNVSAPMIKKDEKNLKVRLERVRILPEKMRTAHLLTFPEFLIYRQNNFESSILNPANLAKVNDIKDAAERDRARKVYPSYKTLAAPGYLNFLAAKDNAIRITFETAGQSEWLCSDKNFLKLKPAK